MWRWLLEPSPDTAGDGRTLPWTILRRQVRPYAFAVSLATAVVFASMLTESGVGESLDSWPGKAIGVAAGITTVLLWAGFWARRDGWMRAGLLASAGYWAAVGAVIMLEPGVSLVSGWLALCWVVASGGAWLLEQVDRRRRA